MELIVRRQGPGGRDERLRIDAAAGGSGEVGVEIGGTVGGGSAAEGGEGGGGGVGGGAAEGGAVRTYRVDVARVREGVYSLRIGGAQHEVVVRRRADGSYWVSDAHGTVAVEVADPLAHLAAQGAAAKGGRRRRLVTAYMPGRVVALLAAEGDAVQAGQGVLVLEAMKMQNEIQAEHEGTVTRILVQQGQPVDGGDPLFEIE